MSIKALLVECDPGNTLGGSCCRDVHNMATYLLENGIDSKNIHILLTNLNKRKMDNVKYSPTQKLLSILDDLELSVGDTLIVLLSGHGYSTGDCNGDEVDGRDECINIGQTIVDDTLYEKIVLKHNKSGINLLLLSDTCHSGTMFDLPYNSGLKSTRRLDDLKVNAISVSACSDSQLSMCDIGNIAGFGGSLTVALLEYGNVFWELINMNYGKIDTIFNRLKLLNQTGLLCISSI
jgi:hypothetical protein